MRKKDFKDKMALAKAEWRREAGAALYLKYLTKLSAKGSNAPEEVVEESKEVKQRVKALKKIQVDLSKTDAGFSQKKYELECKYLSAYGSQFELRRKIILGEYEPTEEECDFVQCSDYAHKGENDEKETKVEAGETKPEKEKVKGIPDFWLTIFQNVEMLQEMISKKDLPILKHLNDVTVKMTEKPMGFTLVFHFSPNEFFTNTQLTKTYEVKCEVDPENPFSFEGPEIVASRGCAIDWAKGKNATVETIKIIPTISKNVPLASFFDFFSPPQIPEGGIAGLDEDILIRLSNDFKIGQYFRLQIIPRAILHYTGEDSEIDEREKLVGIVLKTLQLKLRRMHLHPNVSLGQMLE